MKRSFILGLAGVVFGFCARAANPALPTIPTNVFDVTVYGAVGDGVTDNTTAIQNTINGASAAGGGIVELPAGTYLSGPLTLLSSINLRVDTNAVLQMLPLGTYPGGATNAQTFIYCNTVHDLEISGWGKIDGQGAAWWAYNATNSSIVRPMMLELFSANRLFIHDITFQNPPYHHCGLRHDGGNITISNLTVNTPSPSPNTDGLNFVGTNSIIENCHISDGDDNIAMGSTGVLDDLVITNCTFGTGHGVSIGGGISVGLSNLTVINCTFSGTDYGIRMKSDTNGGAVVQNLSYLNLGMTNIKNGAITIYSYYNEVGTPTSITPTTAAGEIISPVDGSTPIWRNILISNVTATVGSSGVAGIIWGRTEMPATNIVISHVNITASKTFDVYNAQGIQFLDSKIATGGGKTFTIWNANVTVSNSTPATNLITFDGMGGNTNDSLALFNTQASMTSTDAFGADPISLSGAVLTNIGNLTFTTNDVINFVLGTNNASMVVSGNLNLSGTINVTNGNGFAATNYSIFRYTGSLSGQAVGGLVPPGYACTLDTNTAGQVKLVATYTGITAIPTTNILQSSENPSRFGTPVTFTATVSPAPTNGEMVAFKDGATTLGSGTLSGGVATFSTTQLALGSHAVTAVYSGDGAYAGSTSTVLSQVVNPTSGIFFSDAFGSSTINSPTPGAPTPVATSYEIVSSKTWSPLPSITGGHLKFGIGSTSSGIIEIQGLFAAPAVALISPGDFIQMNVTFTDTAGILTQTGAWGFGLYNSDGATPVGGGLNGTLSTNSSTAASGGAQGWQGYLAQIAFTGANSGFYERRAQTGTANNNQDLVSIGSSSSFQNPPASAVGTNSTAPSVTLTAGNQYTESLTCTLTSSNALQLDSKLYAGSGTNGTLLSPMTTTTSTTPLTTIFDALAIGWRATGSTASAMDINSISINGQSTPILSPPSLGFKLSGSTLTLNWPSNYVGWVLQSNTVNLSTTGWSTVPGSGGTNNISVTINPTQSRVFFRLTSQ